MGGGGSDDNRRNVERRQGPRVACGDGDGIEIEVTADRVQMSVKRILASIRFSLESSPSPTK